MLEDRVEQLQRRPRGGEVVHIGIPRTVEARDEREPGVIVEQHEPGLMDGPDRNLVVPGPIPRMVLQRPDRLPQGIPMARPDPEEQAELTRRAHADPRPRRSCSSCCHPSSSGSSPRSNSTRQPSAAAARLACHRSSDGDRFPPPAAPGRHCGLKSDALSSHASGDFAPGWGSGRSSVATVVTPALSPRLRPQQRDRQPPGHREVLHHPWQTSILRLRRHSDISDIGPVAAYHVRMERDGKFP
jgi:hypothetical protein